MNPWEWLKLTWCESRLFRNATSIHRLQAEDLRQRTRRHVHDVSDAIFAAREVAIMLEGILDGMKGEQRDERMDRGGASEGESGSGRSGN